MTHKRIHPIDLISQKNAGMCIVDVRTAAEVKASSLPDCVHIPLHELTTERLHAEINKHRKNGAQIYLLCQSGQRAQIAADQLKGTLNAELYIVEGGMNAVQQSNIPLAPTTNVRAVISLERQVRIAAGFLVFSGVLLGMLVNPSFYFLAGFVGAGLLFAGITNTCAMGMLIARMPWNK
jgi:rhodanese-related sulfurtransferase